MMQDMPLFYVYMSLEFGNSDVLDTTPGHDTKGENLEVFPGTGPWKNFQVFPLSVVS